MEFLFTGQGKIVAFVVGNTLECPKGSIGKVSNILNVIKCLMILCCYSFKENNSISVKSENYPPYPRSVEI